MFSFIRNKKVSDLEWLGIDMHSHILPGIDDGAQSIEQSLDYIKSLHELGLSKLICTPHIFTELYPNTAQTIFPVLELMQQKTAAAGIGVELAAAAEYMTDETFRVEDDLLCLNGKLILIEMSYLAENPNIESVVFDLQVKGYKPVLAHPERYLYYYRTKKRYHRLKQMGCLFQLNLLSVSGYYGGPVKQAAEYLLEEKVYDLVGTDLHHEKHLKTLTHSVHSGKLYEHIGSYAFRNKELMSSL